MNGSAGTPPIPNGSERLAAPLAATPSTSPTHVQSRRSPKRAAPARKTAKKTTSVSPRREAAFRTCAVRARATPTGSDGWLESGASAIRCVRPVLDLDPVAACARR